MEKDLLSLSKEERIEALKQDVQKKERMRKNLYPMNVEIAEEEIDRFFEGTDGIIDRIAESPSIIHTYISEGEILSSTARSNTYEFADIDEAIASIKADLSFRYKAVYFYDLIKIKDEHGSEKIRVRLATAEDEGFLKSKKRDERIQEILDIIDKPR